MHSIGAQYIASDPRLVPIYECEFLLKIVLAHIFTLNNWKHITNDLRKDWLMNKAKCYYDPNSTVSFVMGLNS